MRGWDMSWDIQILYLVYDRLVLASTHLSVFFFFFFEAVCQTLPFMGGESHSSNWLLDSIWRDSNIWLYLALWSGMLRSGIAQIWHIHRHPLSTHMTRSHLFTGLSKHILRRLRARHRIAGLHFLENQEQMGLAWDFSARRLVKLYGNVFHPRRQIDTQWIHAELNPEQYRSKQRPWTHCNGIIM